MRAFILSLASTVAFSAPTEAGSDTTPVTTTDAAPVAEATPAKAPKQPRKLRAKAKPAAKPAADAAPVTVETPAPVVAAEPAVKPLPIARTCATIARQATNFGNLSDRDIAYISYYAGLAKATSDGIVTVRAIADHFAATGLKPNYGGSAKPHDAGVIVRLTKAGFITQADTDGTAFRFTDKATTHKAYAQA